MKHWKTTKKITLITGVALAFAISAFAQDQNQAQAVRLSFVTGQVRITDASNQVITDQAVANTPLFTGYALQTGDDGQAEVQFDDGTVGRIPPDSSLVLSALGEGQNQLTLSNGMAYFTLRGAESIQAAGYVITSSGPSSIRIKLDTPPGELAVFDGTAHLQGNGSVDVSGGQSYKFGGSSVAQSIEPDSWDQWNSDRDQALAQAAGAATPATQGLPDSSNPAWGDLNQNGNWYDVPGEGYVWSPYEASDPGFDPYGDGYWMDTPNYGYTWVSGYSWGYLPYQCGLWNWYSGFGWGWAPGACTPWWRGGGGGWIINIGGHRPGGWRPPNRPNRPHGYHPGNGRPFRPAPSVPVRRVGSRISSSPLPLRDRRNPVTIGNATVVPLRPTNRPNRPVYNHQMPARGTSNGNRQSGNNFNRPNQSNPGQNTRPQFPGTQQQQRPVLPNAGSHARPAPGGAQQVKPNQQQRPSIPNNRPQQQHFSRPAAPVSRPAPSAPRPAFHPSTPHPSSSHPHH